MGEIQENNQKLQTKNSSTTGYRRKHITSSDEIADTFAEHYANTSKDLHKKSKPGKNRNKMREEELLYNKPFTDRELKATINQQKNTAPIIVCKIFERMTNKRGVWYLERERKIDDRQFGFRKQRSTIEAI